MDKENTVAVTGGNYKKKKEQRRKIYALLVGSTLQENASPLNKEARGALIFYNCIYQYDMLYIYILSNIRKYITLK